MGPAWAEISRDADPAWARSTALQAIASEWQWTALPPDYAHMVAASGLLPQCTRLVAQGGAHVESLLDRCAALEVLPTPHPPNTHRHPPVCRRITCLTSG